MILSLLSNLLIALWTAKKPKIRQLNNMEFINYLVPRER